MGTWAHRDAEVHASRRSVSSAGCERDRYATAVTDAIRVRIAGVTAEVSLQGDDAALSEALRFEYRPFSLSVPATADVTAEVASDADAVSAPDEVMATLRDDLLEGIADVHESRGYLRFGAHALIDRRGNALIVLAEDDTDVHLALAQLDLDLEILAPGRWASDLSGAIVHLASPSGDAGELRAGELESARPGRVAGALVFSERRSAGAGGEVTFDGVVALARHIVERATLNERSPLLREVQTIAASRPGIRPVAASDLSDLSEVIGGWLADAERATGGSRAFRVRTAVTTESEGVWHRGPAHDYLDRIDDVVLVRRGDDGPTIDLLASEAASLWRHASGLTRDELFDSVVAQARAGELDRHMLEDAFDELCRTGALATEPSWAIGPDVAWSSTPTQVVALSATAAEAQPVSLEGSARAIWDELVETPHITLTDLVARCARRFDVETSDIRSEVAQLLQDLRRRELVGWI